MTYLERATEILEQIRRQHRYRELPAHQLAGIIDYSSNDYLALSGEPQVVEALRRARRVGSGGARLLAGRHREHWLLEEELASWLGRERALLFSSGYLAAIGTIPVLAQLVDATYSDRFNHASLIDGIRLARAGTTIYEHAGVPLLLHDPALVVTESLFSMEGDCVDLRSLLNPLSEAGILLVDEAHALGIAGPDGGGFARGLDDERVLVLGTLSKALGVHGGFIAGPARLIELLVNRARTFVFDTALPPPLMLAARVALYLTRRSDDRRLRLRANVQRLCEGMRRSGYAVGDAAGAIVSLVIGSEQDAVALSNRLFERRMFVPAIRPPTVPPSTSRLRISVRCDHTAEQIDQLIEALARCTATS